MEFDLSDTQRLMQQSARKFLSKECPAERMRSLMDTDTALDPALWQAIAEQGWLGIFLSGEFGGVDLGLVELAVVAEEMGRACLPGPVLANVLAAALIDRAAEGSTRESLLRAIATGERRATVALVDEGYSWRQEDVHLEASRDAKQIRLYGTKHLVLDAAVADLLVCVARADDELVLATVKCDTPRVTITATPSIDPTRKMYRVEFENVAIDKADFLASGEAAEAALSYAIGVATVTVCAEMVGAMSWILETALDYVKTRQQFGRPIGSYQAVQHQCADMLFMLESARSATYYAAWALSEGDAGATRAVSIAKAYCSDAAREVGNRGIQVHGGIGFTWEHNLHLYYKRVKLNEILFGDTTFHRERLAELVLDTPAS